MSRSNDGAYRFSNSEIKTWKRCKRKWWLAYHRLLQPATQSAEGALAIGTRVHLALATYYGGKWDQTEALAVYNQSATDDIDRMTAADPFYDPKKLVSEIELGRIMIEGYFQWVEETGADEGLTIINPETVIEAPIDIKGDDVRIRGKLDLRIRREFDGARMFLDHKTAASLNQANMTILKDEQMLMYQLLERLEAWAIGGDEGERTDGGIYSMLRKVKRTDRAKPPFYDRIEIRHNETELRNFYTRVHGEIIDILRAEKFLRDGGDHQWIVPPNPTRDCSWDCPFFEPCRLMDDGSRVEALIESYYVIGDPDARYAEDEKAAKGASPDSP